MEIKRKLRYNVQFFVVCLFVCLQKGKSALPLLFMKMLKNHETVTEIMKHGAVNGYIAFAILCVLCTL